MIRVVNLSRKTRNLKTLVKSLVNGVRGLPVVYKLLMDTGNDYIIVICSPKVEYRYRRVRDKLSNLSIMIREAVITICGKPLFRIVWDGQYYGVALALDNNPFIIRVRSSSKEFLVGVGDG